MPLLHEPNDRIKEKERKKNCDCYGKHRVGKEVKGMLWQCEKCDRVWRRTGIGWSNLHFLRKWFYLKKAGLRAERAPKSWKQQNTRYAFLGVVVALVILAIILVLSSYSSSGGYG